MKLFQQLKQLITGQVSSRTPQRLTDRYLIEQESLIGRELFGPIPDGHKREFFCLDAKTWVWHEEWRDENNAPQTSTTRYEVQPGGVLKVQPGRVYKYLDGEELENLALAVRMYYDRSMREIYKFDPQTGQPINRTPATIYS